MRGGCAAQILRLSPIGWSFSWVSRPRHGLKRRCQVYLPARSAYLRWVMRLLSLEPDEGIIEEVASKPEDAGPGLAIEPLASLRRLELCFKPLK